MVEEFSQLKATMKDKPYLQQSLELANNIFGEDALYSAKYHFLLGYLSQSSSQTEEAYNHYNDCLKIISNKEFANEFLKKKNTSNIILLKNKLSSLKLR